MVKRETGMRTRTARTSQLANPTTNAETTNGNSEPNPALEHQLKLLAEERDKCLQRLESIMKAAHHDDPKASSGKFTDPTYARVSRHLANLYKLDLSFDEEVWGSW